MTEGKQSLSQALLCADIGGTNMRLIRLDPLKHVTHRCSAPTPAGAIDLFVLQLEKLVQSIDASSTSLHIALAGLQDPETGLCTAANISALDGQPLAAILSDRLGKEVRIANDADCFALAESRIGAARGHAVVFGAILGTGVGGGLTFNGKIARAPAGLTGEWGHGPFLREGDSLYPHLTCGCGQKGCLDTIGGARGLERLHLWLTGETVSSRVITQRWLDAEGSVSETMRRYIAILSDALACIVNITGAGCVPVGGGMSTVTPLIEALDINVRAKILRATFSPIIVKAKLGNDAGLMGASYL